MNAAPRLKVISLVRVSSEGQAANDRTGIPRQLEDIEAHCSTHNLEVVEEYRLEGISGANVQHSRQFQEMLSKLSQPSIAGIVFATIDRFFRPEYLSTYQVFAPFESTGKLFYCDMGVLNPRDQQDQMKIIFYGQGAGMDRKRLKDNMVRGKEKNRHRADVKSDPLPVGVAFDKTTGKFRYTEESKRIKAAMYRVVKGEETLRAISDGLAFSSQTSMRQALHHLWWIGLKATTQKRVDHTLTADGKRTEGRKVKRDAPIIVKTNLAESPLVPEDVFNRAQEILAEKTKTWTQRRTLSSDTLGIGLMYCQCGRKMYAKRDSRPGKAGYYMCSSYYTPERCSYPLFPIAKIDEKIRLAVLAYLIDERFLALKVKEAIDTTRSDERTREKQALEKEISNIERKKNKLMIAMEDLDEDSIGTCAKRIKALGEDQAVLKIKRDSLRSEDGLDGSTPEEIADQIKQRFFGFDGWDRAQQKATLAGCVKSITLDTDGHADFTVRVGMPIPSWKPELEGRHPAGFKAFRDYMAAQTLDAKQKSHTDMASS